MRKYIAMFLCCCLLTVVCYAANTGISLRDDQSGDSVVSRPASSTDLGKGDALNAPESLDGVQVVSIRAGQVVISPDDEDPAAPASALASVRSANDYGYYIDLESNSLGSRLYVPSDYIEGSFCIDNNGRLLGTRNSSFTCYIGQYSVRFPVYSTPQYRLTSGTGYTWQDIDLVFSSSPNVSVAGARENFWSDKVQTLILLLIGGLAVCLYLKR